MMIKKSTAAIAVILVFLTSLLLVTNTAEGDHRKICVAFPSFTPAYGLLWIAKDKKIFEKNGLDVEIIAISGSAPIVQANLSGELDFGMSSSISPIGGALQGTGQVIIAGLFNSFPYQLFGAKNIKQISDLKGKKVAISRFGGPAEYMARFVLSKGGLKAPQDVALIQVGGYAERVTAVLVGVVDATLVEPPHTLVARKSGLNLLADVPKLGLEAQHTCLFTTKNFIAGHPKTVQLFMKSLVESIDFYRNRKEETITVMSKNMRITDREILSETYEYYIEKGIPPKPYPTLTGIQTLLDLEAEKNPKARGIKAEQLVDIRFVQELDRSGYIESLYK